MTYNPTPDRSAEIIANAGNNTAQITAQGNANFQNQLTSSFNTAMGMLSKNVESKNADAAKANTNAGTGQALDQVYKTYGTPEQRQDFLLGLEKVSGNQDKTAGYLAMHQQTGQSLVELNKSKQIADIYGANNKDLAMWKSENTAAAVAEPKLDANYARQGYQSLRSRGYTHEQAIEGMNAGGMNWGVQYINRPESNSFWGSNP